MDQIQRSGNSSLQRKKESKNLSGEGVAKKGKLKGKEVEQIGGGVSAQKKEQLKASQESRVSSELLQDIEPKERKVEKIPLQNQVFFKGLKLYARSVCYIADASEALIKNAVPCALKCAGELLSQGTIGLTLEQLGYEATVDKGIEKFGKTLVGRKANNLTEKLGAIAKKQIIKQGTNLPHTMLKQAIKYFAVSLAKDMGIEDTNMVSAFATDFYDVRNNEGTLDDFIKVTTASNLANVIGPSLTDVKIQQIPLKMAIKEGLKKLL